MYESPGGQLGVAEFGSEKNKNKKPRGGRATGSQNFTEGDRRRALSVIQRVKPFGANKWEQVSTQYNMISRTEKRKERDADFLKKYYTDKIREGLSKPTGDPNLSWELHEVKLIRQEIDGLLQMGSIEDDYENSEDQDEEVDILSIKPPDGDNTGMSNCLTKYINSSIRKN